jgi:hypothetical protein
MELQEIYLETFPEHIAYVKFIFESYEEVGIIRTVDRKKAIIVLLAMDDFLDTARSILASIQRDVPLPEIPRPPIWVMTGSCQSRGGVFCSAHGILDNGVVEYWSAGVKAFPVLIHHSRTQSHATANPLTKRSCRSEQEFPATAPAPGRTQQKNSRSLRQKAENAIDARRNTETRGIWARRTSADCRRLAGTHS